MEVKKCAFCLTCTFVEECKPTKVAYMCQDGKPVLSSVCASYAVDFVFVALSDLFFYMVAINTAEAFRSRALRLFRGPTEMVGPARQKCQIDDWTLAGSSGTAPTIDNISGGLSRVLLHVFMTGVYSWAQGGDMLGRSGDLLCCCLSLPTTQCRALCCAPPFACYSTDGSTQHA